ncbi:peptide/nickel transport system ATP-binding protein/oligopeptide transport system ATP-binding protein [Evansella caseinilytica]|uniref:Peptide/nickel transport system ATP-binding protein/oligopeptide transport system ATP-binding protein n=1 Tax=Evansella caseinilytica TaxID=1503961 RepID=A0A1H3HKS0_9BACI|nr:ABC transporter ATP-binding protein [Evansella caseinilytica]SDY15970.1 peptide/nickel transport system ATP-binding protein/oligopeptide transport system ATP-binding protein [Evansella caseinilytica]
MENQEPLLQVEDLAVSFTSSSGTVKAVNGVSFTLHHGETIGIVGESGSGKSVTATSILRLLPPRTSSIDGGRIVFEGENLVALPPGRMRRIRGNDISMIFQDPMTSLNPVFTIGNQLVEAIRLHQQVTKKEAVKRAVEMLRLVGIPEPERRIRQYPHEFSGGMRQRAMIAIALSCHPKLLIADEPTTALDVTVQAQILRLMKELQNKLKMAIILITHDLGVVWENCDKVIVMYAGSVVETTSVNKLYVNPLHPYTWGLLDSQVQAAGDKQAKLTPIPGTPPDLRNEIAGCPFAERCGYAKEVCFEEKPELTEVEAQHHVACHFQTAASRLERNEVLI